MGSRLPGRVAVVPSPPQGRGWGPAKSFCVNGFAGGPAVEWCSGSAAIVTGATGIAASDAGGVAVQEALITSGLLEAGE